MLSRNYSPRRSKFLKDLGGEPNECISGFDLQLSKLVGLRSSQNGTEEDDNLRVLTSSAPNKPKRSRRSN
jgi:hypothetical protein